MGTGIATVRVGSYWRDLPKVVVGSSFPLLSVVAEGMGGTALGMWCSADPWIEQWQQPL